MVGAMDPDVLVSHLDDFRDVLIKINDDVSALEPDTRPVTPRVDREPNRAPPASQNSSRRPRPTHWEDPTGPPPLGVPFGPSPRPASFPHTKHPQTFSNPDLTPQPPTPNTQLSHAESTFERLKQLDVEEQAAFVDAHARGLDATIAAMSSLQSDTCAHFRVGHADASDGLDDTEQALQRQATEGSIALLSQESDLRRVRTALDELRDFTRVELRHQREVSEWTTRASRDFLEDLREDKKKVAAETVNAVGRRHADGRVKRMEHHVGTFGALSAFIESSADEQGRKTLELHEVIDRTDRRLGISR